ncbi:hypothetical protein T4A_8910 [Trichinella pseudospiralis]|uniref:Uncharacterized protein n=1 Tax=Trichinella pseudospiralis TaxID=6337 RepID=A0A0V1DQ40_TRIPS|nr:hypothetical protein T4A_8910 [Trichinella pseudospiralis]
MARNQRLSSQNVRMVALRRKWTKLLHFYQEKMTTQLSIPYPINSVNFTALCSKKPVHRYNKKTVPGDNTIQLKERGLRKVEKIKEEFLAENMYVLNGSLILLLIQELEDTAQAKHQVQDM